MFFSKGCVISCYFFKLFFKGVEVNHTKSTKEIPLMRGEHFRDPAFYKDFPHQRRKIRTAFRCVDVW